MLDDLGLAAAVEWLVSNFVSRYGIDTDAQIEVDQGEPSKLVATALFRTVQEALTNIAKHAQATSAGAAVLQRRAHAQQRRRRHAGQPGLQAAARAGLQGIRERSGCCMAMSASARRAMAASA